ncbi:hypothetical protein U1Q18_047431 [Sarracenia purpurea var. burkii]
MTISTTQPNLTTSQDRSDSQVSNTGLDPLRSGSGSQASNHRSRSATVGNRSSQSKDLPGNTERSPPSKPPEGEREKKGIRV